MGEEIRVPEYKLILNATDGSEVSKSATRQAIYLARNTGAELLILHVVETSFAWYTGAFYQQLVDELRAFGDQVLESAAQMAEQAGVQARTMSVDGQSGTAIVRVAEREGADLVVLGAPCPVLVVK